MCASQKGEVWLIPRTLILGGARSGKSRYALELVEGLSEDRVFVATGVWTPCVSLRFPRPPFASQKGEGMVVWLR